MASLLETMGASWIWPADRRQMENQVVEFRHEFELDRVAGGAELVISADSNYAAWLNGTFLDFGQFSDYPERKTFDTLDAGSAIRAGKNTLTVLVFHQGKDFFSYIKGVPGVIYGLRAGNKTIVSGTDAFYRKSGYKEGPMPHISGQLATTFEYDARVSDEWQQVQVGDVVAERRQTGLSPRPVKKLIYQPRLTVPIQAHGVFKRVPDPKKTVAQLMYTDYLSPRAWPEMSKEKAKASLPSEAGIRINPELFEGKDNDGVYFVIDLGREEAGIFDLDIDTSAGAVVDVGYGEHLDDLRVRSAVGDRNFANRYIAREGRQEFTHYFTRWAGRYIQLHISGAKQLTLYYAGLRPTEYPVEVRGRFQSPDHLQNEIYRVSIRTLELCMHEHYEDCPWREQALYANDSRNQALCGYYVFGDYQFPKVSFGLLGDSVSEDGYLELCAPAKIRITIPSFTFCWFLEVADYFKFSGDLEFIRGQMDRMKKMLATHVKTISGDLFPCPQGERYWHFYDWAPGLEGITQDCTNFENNQIPTRYDAPLNAFFILTLEAVAGLAKVLGDQPTAGEYQTLADRMKTAFHATFWDRERQAYVTSTRNDVPRHFAELTQALAILAGIAPTEVAGILRQQMAKENNGLVETTLSQSIYKFQALMTDKDMYSGRVFDKIAGDWKTMLFSGATSFWETLKGGWDFDNAGSLCHGWSAVPIYFYQAHLLGIKPTEPGFKTFTVDPVTDVVSEAAGRVPTPFGPIDLSWKKVGDRIEYTLSHPREVKPIIVNSSMIRKG